MKKVFSICVVLTIVLQFLAYGFPAAGAESVGDESIQNIFSFDSSLSYSEYISGYADVSRINDDIIISRENAVDSSLDFLEDKDGNSMFKISEDKSAEFIVNTEKAGLYAVELHHNAEADEKSAAIKINGATPFKEANNIKLSGYWVDEADKIYDDNNQVRTPSNVGEGGVVTVCHDSAGYISAPLLFHIPEGQSTVAITSLYGSITFSKIVLTSEVSVISYKEAKNLWESNKIPFADVDLNIQEAADYFAKSDQAILTQADRSSSLTQPYHVSKTRYNTIGAGTWSTVNQWVSWKVEVPESGLYNIGFRWKQNTKNIGSSYRQILIDDELQFDEAAYIKFPYSSGWNASFACNGEGEGYLFYLEKGEREIKMSVSLGLYSEIISRTNQSALELNKIYRNIVAITGPEPDRNRDYEFEKILPETINLLKAASEKLAEIREEIEKIDGQSGENTSSIRRTITQLDFMWKKPETIARRLKDFQECISSLGTWINAATAQPLELDCIYISAPKEELPKANSGFFKTIWHYLAQFIYSFVENYNSFESDGDAGNKVISVWVGAGVTGGRDQAQMLKQIISNKFTQQKGISVDLKLVSASSLLPATLAGIGADVALQISSNEVMNFAFRGALAPLTQYYDEGVFSRFDDNAVNVLKYQDVIYGVPETQNFAMLFYRKDILSDLEIAPAHLDTWESLISEVVPRLQKNGMQFGLAPSLGAYSMFLYQNGGSLYLDGGKKSGLYTEEAVSTLTDFISLYSDYKLPQAFDFANRFRTGEIPLAIADYSAFNQLSVFAPEISELWGMKSVPGTKKENGTIDRTSMGGVAACVMFNSAKNKEECWEFMSWWTSAEIQRDFGKSLESLMGVSARYATANKEAMGKMGWNRETEKAILKQWESIKIIPEVPGGYYTDRHFNFVFRGVLLNGEDLREALDSAVRAIDKEIGNKRLEYGTDN